MLYYDFALIIKFNMHFFESFLSIVCMHLTSRNSIGALYTNAETTQIGEAIK